MASVAAVTSGINTSGTTYNTGSISAWTSGSYGIMAIWFDTDPGSTTVTGGSVTWSQLGSTYNAWSGADDVYMLVFMADGTPATGAITVTPTNSFTTSVWYADEAADTDGTTDTPVTTEGEATAHTSPDVGTLDTDDVAYLFVWGSQNTTLTAQAGTTILTERDDGANSVSNTCTAYSTTDETPGVNGALNQYGTFAFVINNAAASGTALPSILANH